MLKVAGDLRWPPAKFENPVHMEMCSAYMLISMQMKLTFICKD